MCFDMQDGSYGSKMIRSSYSHFMNNRLLDMDQKLAMCEHDRKRLLDANKRLVEKIGEYTGPIGSAAVLCEKLEARNREIAQLKLYIRTLETKALR
ncbi:hypothetical protein Q1695_009213 [Nippostrongylus brasiliensis]|nr:hypothetical protein Q1695_009213 [Nippostrongylus brasiliensis]